VNPNLVQGLAVGLSTLAGFVDALGYLALGGLFVAFMSGNSTVMGVSAVDQTESRMAVAGGVVAMFVFGVMLGTWVGRPFAARRPPVILVLVGTLLASAAGLARFGLTVPACLVVALAMGAENTVFQKNGVTGIGLTYMTGTLVRLGQKAAEAVVGGPWRAIVPDASLWLGMVAGAGFGAMVYRRIGLDGLWGAALVAVALSGLALWGQRRT
jgi:uncharacterized membrane protein YoaK (UPF0700 family)